MKDRNAFVENKITRGTDPDLVKTPRERGIPAGAHKGLVEANPPHKGLPEHEARGLIQKTDYFINPPKKVAPKCKGKDGTCKAHPVKGTDLCIGHTRANAKAIR